MGTCHVWRGCCASLLFLLAPLQGAQAGSQQPTLAHSAPRLGQVFSIRVESAPASAAIELYFAPAAGSFATPDGTLALERTSTRSIDRGTRDTSGR